MNNEQKEVIQQDPEQKEVATPTESKEQDVSAQILQTLNSINERIVNLEEKTKEKASSVSEEDVYKSLNAQKEMMEKQFKVSSEKQNVIVSPEEQRKELMDSINFSFDNGAYSKMELQHEFNNPYVAYSRNSYIFKKFFEQTGIKPRFENVEELTRYYTNKNRMNPISAY